MKKIELERIIREALAFNNVPVDATVKLTWHGNRTGYCVCVRIPHFSTLTGCTEYSAPVGTMVYCIQTPDRVKQIIANYVKSYGLA